MPKVLCWEVSSIPGVVMAKVRALIVVEESFLLTQKYMNIGLEVTRYILLVGWLALLEKWAENLSHGK